MLKAVCFDMDETLLDINLGAFVALLIKDEAGLYAAIGRRNPFSMMALWAGALLDLNNNARAADDHDTNHRFFCRSLAERSDVPLDDPAVADVFETYERDLLPRRNNALIGAAARPGAHEALETVLDRGLRIALLTNPSFSRACIACRMGWGELTDYPFELVTSWETSTRVKPDSAYYLESLDALGLAPHEVLMVGNDPKRDFPEPDCGIQTAYVGAGKAPERALWSGSMEDFAQAFPQIEERLYERQERLAQQ